MKLNYLQIQDWIDSEDSGLSPQQKAAHPGLCEFLFKFQNHLFPDKTIDRQMARHDMGHGMCCECLKNWAEKDYNGHNHWVCLDCFDKLWDEFEEEYK